MLQVSTESSTSLTMHPFFVSHELCLKLCALISRSMSLSLIIHGTQDCWDPSPCGIVVSVWTP